MKFVFGKQDMTSLRRAQESCFLMTNGLGGFASTSAAFSVTRNDQGILLSARTAPNDRVNLVHRLSEKLISGEEETFLSTQEFVNAEPEEGYRHLSSFTWEYIPVWQYDVAGVRVTRKLAMGYEKNLTAVCYRLENRSEKSCTLEVRPFFPFAPKGNASRKKFGMLLEGESITANGLTVYLRTDGERENHEGIWQKLAYADDKKDGRPAWGYAGCCTTIRKTAAPGETAELQILFSDRPTRTNAKNTLTRYISRQKTLEKSSGFAHPVARQLARAAADFVAHRESTDGKTILAGFPFFGDWGRDTMIALPGCVLSRQDKETAKSILRTFLVYEKGGLVPNLFPEGESQPMYNTVDAALLLINGIWLYHQRFGDPEFVREAWPVMERIASAYQRGTHHGIHMDEDGLVCAGQGKDQVTWMDVCVDGILPTPRHGKPVEINAYWYNALRILGALAPEMGADGTFYELLAEQVKDSFLREFWMEDKGWLKDVISGTAADMQLRCNQIWAITMPFGMLSREQERRVVDAVYRDLYTPCGLRTLAPWDAEFHPIYGGPQKERDMAYHQGTVWPFPLGAYYLAYLKVNDFSEEARETVYEQLAPLEASLREGCVGQLPEIYSGLCPGASQGCFAQAWSVGELLRVYEALEKGSF